MADSKHTPGPWWIAGEGTIRSGTGKRDRDAGWIADVNWRNRDANARLIAAAPELLDALKLAASIIGHPDDEMSKYIASIIAKATTP